MVCAFSGHRPKRLPWGYCEEDPRCVALKQRMQEEIEALIAQGVDTFLCGMAQGCDAYFAEAVLRCRVNAEHISLIAVLPCREQAHLWPQADQERHAQICAQAAQTLVLEETYAPGCMQRRNRWLVEHADVLLTVYDGGEGGTGTTVRHAQRMGVAMVPLWV